MLTVLISMYATFTAIEITRLRLIGLDKAAASRECTTVRRCQQPRAVRS